MGIKLAICILFGLVLLLSLQFVSAQSCCIEPDVPDCRDVSSCPDSTCDAGSGKTCDPDSCDLVYSCDYGCCCQNGLSVLGDAVTRRVACDPTTFPLADFVEAESGSCDAICLIPPPTYTVSGTVRNQTNGPVAGASISVSGELITGATNSQGVYSMQIKEGTRVFIVSKPPECNETNKTVVVDQSKTVDFDMLCNVVDDNTTEPPGDPEGACEPSDVQSNLKLTYIELTSSNEVNLKWLVNSTCDPAALSFKILRAKDDYQNPANFGLIGQVDESPFHDSGPLENHTYYYYKVIAVFPDNEEVESANILFVKTGAEECADRGELEFCEANARARCTLENGLEIIQECYPELCVEVTGVGTYCKGRALCEDCNRVYGMYGYLDDLTVQYILPTGSEVPLACSDLPNRKACYLDSSQTVVDPFKNCADATSCTVYTSEEACGEDICNVGLDCNWREVYGSAQSDELGLGVCTSSGAGACEACNSLPDCNWNSCTALGDCYYNGQCIPFEDVTCNEYDNIAHCQGGRAVIVNAVYDASEPTERIDGTHVVTESFDYVGLGKCYWIGANNDCYKNADNYRRIPVNDYPDDCPLVLPDTGAENPDYERCSKDFEAPNTDFAVYDEGVVGRTTPLPYYVTDNVYTIEGIKTWYCFSAEGEGECYPNILSVGRVDVPADANGENTLYFYSQDGAKNLELIDNIVLQVDTGLPMLSATYNVTSFTAGSTFLSDLQINMQVDDDSPPVDCEWELKKDGTLIGTKQTRRVDPTPESFSYTYEGLSDGTYGFTLFCKDIARNNDTFTLPNIIIEGDTRIFNPLPNTTLSTVSGVLLSLETEAFAVCRYHDTLKLFDEMGAPGAGGITFYSEGPRTYHSSDMHASVSQSGVYKFHLACLVTTDQTYIVEGNDADVIKFALDQLAPVTIRSNDSNRIVNQPLDLRCDDDAPELLDENNNSWAFGCEQIYLCDGPGCTPIGLGVNEKTITLENEGIQNFSFYSKDTAGNQESMHEIEYIFDITPPEFLDLDIYAEPQITVNDTYYTAADVALLVGVVSTDTVQVCTYNEFGLGEGGCANECDGSNNDFCIKPNGSFSKSFNLHEVGDLINNTINITALDHIGLSSTIELVIMKDIVGPSAPTFNIEE